MCLYPIVDRCGWDDARHWHNSGLWDLSSDIDGRLRRILNREYADGTRVCAGTRCAGDVMKAGDDQTDCEREEQNNAEQDPISW